MSYMYVPLINRPTRVSPYSATLIDNIFTNAIDLVESNNCNNGILFNDLKDHFPVFHIQLRPLKTISSHEIYTKRIINTDTFKNLKQDLASQNWDEVMSSDDINEGYNKFLDIILNSYQQNIPTKILKIKNNKKPWITNGLLVSIRKKKIICAIFEKSL